MIRASSTRRLSLVVVLVGCPAGGSEDDEVGATDSTSTDSTSTSTSSTSTESSSTESSSTESTTTESGSSETESSSTESSSTTESGSETGGVVVPGECVEELDEPGADEFVGDGIPDAHLLVRMTNSLNVPNEIDPGHRIHIQGSYWWALLCGDDDIACRDSFVIRSYPDERFLLAQLHGADLQPQPSPTFFDAIGIDPGTWLRPFTLTTHDDMLCSWELGVCQNPNIITRHRLHVDAGSCETAKLLDDSQGHFGQLYFVSVDELELAEGGTLCVDDATRSSVYIAKLPCQGGGACPPTADVFECPPNDQLQDEAQLVYDAGWEPSELVVDLVCEVLDSTLPSLDSLISFTLDCGMLAP